MTVDQRTDIKDFVNSPWWTRVMMGILIFFAQQLVSTNNELKSQVEVVKTDVEVLKKQIQILTDYSVNPKH